MATILGYY